MAILASVLRVIATLVGFAFLVQGQHGQTIPDSMSIEPNTDLNTLPNNSLYLRWRPRYHVLAPGGHMNDPCGPMYDPKRKQYHIFYQSFPQHVGFGNTSWSHAVSSDLVTWTDVRGWQNREMVAVPVGKYPQYDWIGAFSGGAQPVGLTGKADGNLTLMYTGANKFPDNWQLPYKPMTEQQAIATSSDGGVTWQKWEGNPVLPTAPGGYNVTGARDPLFSQLPLLDIALGYEPNSHWYITIGSGIRGGVGPRIPLYQTPANDLTKWKFLGPLNELPGNFSFGGDQRITGNHGFNYEMSALFDMTEEEQFEGDGKTSHWVLTMGAEGYPAPFHPLTHWSLFTLGTISRRDNGNAEYIITASGVLDWAGSYALNQFYDPVKKRRLIWGWADEDMNSYGTRQQGFQGALNIPREPYILVKHNVIPPPGKNIHQAAETWTSNGDGTYTIKTLASRAAPDIVDGIQGGKSGKDLGSLTVSDRTAVSGINSSHFHLKFTVPLVPADGRLSMLLRATPDYAEYVNITYLSSNASVLIDRSHSTLLSNLSTTFFAGTFYPFTTSSSGSNGGWSDWGSWSGKSRQQTETLTIDIFQDGSMIEFFINDRFAASSRTYPSRADSLGFAFEASSPVKVENMLLWDQMINIFPERPLNASSPLIFDPYYETHLTFPNPYVDEGVAFYDGFKKRSIW